MSKFQLIKTFAVEVMSGDKDRYSERVNATMESMVKDISRMGYQIFKDTLLVEEEKIYCMGIYVGTTRTETEPYTRKNWFSKEEKSG